MERRTILIVLATIVIGGASFAYGALSAQTPTTRQQVAVSTKPSVPAAKPSASPSAKPSSQPITSLSQQLTDQLPTIQGALTAAYPKISTDYTVGRGKLYGDGNWYGTTLTYKGTDTANRDTLRVLMQKKDGVWTVRTKPPQPMLSTTEFPDVPKSALQDINKAVSLP
jgi:hypothetical protein